MAYPNHFSEVTLLIHPDLNRPPTWPFDDDVEYQLGLPIKPSNDDVHETFRTMAPVPEFSNVLLNNSDASPFATPQSVSCREDDNRLPIRFAHISRDDYAKPMFTKDYCCWNKNLAWLWSLYGGMNEHGLVGNCKRQGVNPMEVSNGLPRTTELHFQGLSEMRAWLRFASVVILSWKTSQIRRTQGFSKM